jgi:hypothetical protein
MFWCSYSLILYHNSFQITKCNLLYWQHRTGCSHTYTHTHYLDLRIVTEEVVPGNNWNLILFSI